MSLASRNNSRKQPGDRTLCVGQKVARYDDDYPLLYGEPAPQPQWDAAADQAPAQMEQSDSTSPPPPPSGSPDGD